MYDDEELAYDPEDPVMQARVAAQVMRGKPVAKPVAPVPFAPAVTGGMFNPAAPPPAQPVEVAPGDATPGAPSPAERQRASIERQRKIDEMLNTAPDTAEMVAHAERKQKDADRKLMLGLTLASMGGSAHSGLGNAMVAQAMKEGGDYEIPGGWGVASPKGVVWNPMKRREADLSHLQFLSKQEQDAEQREAARVEARARWTSEQQMRRDIAQQGIDSREMIAGALAGARERRGSASDRRRAEGRPLPTTAVNKITELEGKVDQFDDLISSWDDSYGGLGAAAETAYGKIAPDWMSSKDLQKQTAWWTSYQSFVNEVRHGLFGAALTPPEKAEFERSVITSSTNPNVIFGFLRKQHRIAEKARDRYIANLGRAGFNATGFQRGGDAPTDPDAPPGAPPGAGKGKPIDFNSLKP